MQLYLAGPLFTQAERDTVDVLAERLETAGHSCFVPHRQTFEPLDAPTVFAVDAGGLRGAEAVVAILDGPLIDDGTACEIGMFAELVRLQPDQHQGIIGLATDWRTTRRLESGMTDGGLNFFVAGAIMEYGEIVWSIDEVVTALERWA